MAQVVFINTETLGTDRAEKVEVHSPTCSHMAKYRKHPFFDHYADYPEEWATAQDFFDDYNSDFYAESGHEGTWDIAFFPCSGLVKKTTVIDRMSY